MSQAPARSDADPNEREGTLGLIGKSIARALVVLVVYVTVATLLSWASFLWIGRDVWSTAGAMPIARAGPAAAPLVILLALLMPQTWITLLYVVGFPALAFLLGQKAAIHTALARIARGRAGQVAQTLARRCFPACELLAKTPGNVTVRRAAHALRRRLDDTGAASMGRTTRWLMRRALVTLRVPELCSATSFLDDVRERPDDARTTLARVIQERIVEFANEGSRFSMLWVVVGVLLALTASHGLWVGWLGGASA